MMKNNDLKKTTIINNISFNNKWIVNSTELLFYFVLSFNFIYVLYYTVYSSLYNYFHYIIFFFTVLLFVSSQKIKFKLINTVKLIIFLVLSAAAIFINHSGIGLLILIFWPLSIIYIFKNVNFSKNYINRLNIIILTGWELAIIATSQYTTLYFDNFNSETIGINPNTIAIVIAIACLFIALHIDNSSKPKSLKIIVYILSVLALCRTRSRTSLVAFLAILMMEFFLKKQIKKSKKLAILVMIAIVALGIIFPFVYVILFNKGILAYETLFFGKRIYTGRQYIWLNLWNYVQTNKNAYIWGVGYNTELYSRGTFNLHNAYLMIFAQYGIPLLILYLIYLFCVVSKMFGKFGRISDLQFKCYQIILFALIVGYGETVLSYLPNMIFFATAIGIGYRERTKEL